MSRHNGTISAEATPDRGATFTITLPLHQKKPAEIKERNNTFINIVMNRR